MQRSIPVFLFTIIIFLSSMNVSSGVGENNPLTAKGLIRYWKKRISNNVTKPPDFLLSKASPLNAVQASYFIKLLEGNALASHLPSFCISANLSCFFDLGSEKQHFSVNSPTFKSYNINYNKVPPGGAGGSNAGVGEFKSKEDGNVPNFRMNSRKFFRESMLKEGSIMRMPSIKDLMPKRSFLPRSIASKLPFSTSKISEAKQIFHAVENSTMEKILQKTLKECEGAVSLGETKICVDSIEDMIDFSVSVLGQDVVVRTTENVEGSQKDVMMGTVKGINRGQITKSVSCHESRYPYMVYYCHSVPRVKVYEADILDAKSELKINHAIAICHIDTSLWSPTHEAFLELGSGPGLIEVCHWIFGNDMTWFTSD